MILMRQTGRWQWFYIAAPITSGRVLMRPRDRSKYRPLDCARKGKR